MTSSTIRSRVVGHLLGGGHLTLFLDFDGTLVPIARTPAEAKPDAALLPLLTELAAPAAIRTVILSGRPLADLKRMLPVHGLVLGGIYGAQMQLNGRTILRARLDASQQEMLSNLMAQWVGLTGGLDGFLVEDKGAAVALHARWAEPPQAERVLQAARDGAMGLVRTGAFRLLDGESYLEVAPSAADKGQTVNWFLEKYPVPDDLQVCFGDDNKDEAAFASVQKRGGLAVAVGNRYPLPDADARLESPSEVRDWLEAFAQAQQGR